MEVRREYKLTEVGAIRSGWSAIAFGALYAEPSRNGIYKSAEYQGRGTRIVNMGEMFGFEFISNQEMSRVSLSLNEMETSGLLDGDLVFGRRSVVPAGAGKCSLIVNPPEPLTFESSIIRVRLDQSKASPLFYYYFFASSTGRSVMSAIIAGTNIKGIRGTELRELEVPHPDPTEQRAIAAALSDVDALLGGLERLIAKKRDLKQATMQQILTGHTRLPGFPGEWVVKPLGEVAPLQRGFDLPNPELRPGPYPVVYSNGVINHHARYQVRGPGVVTGRSGTIGNVTYLEEPYWPHNTALWVTNFKNNDPRFVFYLYTHIGFERFATGSGVPTLNRNDVHTFQVTIPLAREEQAAIAGVLSDLDAEISALVARRDKTRALKQAMMQELLTGKTRLVPIGDTSCLNSPVPNAARRTA